VVFKKAFHIRL